MFRIQIAKESWQVQIVLICMCTEFDDCWSCSCINKMHPNLMLYYEDTAHDISYRLKVNGQFCNFKDILIFRGMILSIKNILRFDLYF
jgi:hypothetical protein